MNTLLNIVFLIIFSIFLFYWFQNLIKKNKKYLYVPYKTEDSIPIEETEVIEPFSVGSQENISEDYNQQETNDLPQFVNSMNNVTERNILTNNSIIHNWDSYI